MEFLLLSLGIIEKALITATFLGLLCGMLGTFIVLRKIALIGDAISHSILPGIVLGFIISTSLGLNRDPTVILISALLVGLFSIAVVRKIETSTRVKSDAALGVILSGFFGLGLFMKSSLKPFMESASGIQSYLFGNIATVSDGDFYTLIITGTVLIVLTIIFLRPLLLVSFDAQYARSIGFPKTFLNLLFYTILTLTIVVSVQAVGVILISALLIIPASAAFLLTDRKLPMILIAMVIGGLSGLVGAIASISAKGINLPSGATMTLVAASLFFLAYFFAPSHGIFSKWLNHRTISLEIAIDNALKSFFRLLEPTRAFNSAIEVKTFLDTSDYNVKKSHAFLKKLHSLGFIELATTSLTLTTKGRKRAEKIVRSHRLWELYLARQADYKPDHVHDDAEIMEHILDEQTIRELEHELGNPKTDPHGKPIPQS